MPWPEKSLMSLRKEFVTLAMNEEANLSQLCRGFQISRKTGYKWLARYRREGARGLRDRPRRPRGSPWNTAPEMEAAVLQLREQHPAWGGRKLRARLQAVDAGPVPAASTITAILRRHGRLDPEAAAKHRPWQRFEAPAPNELWQMDFKGHFPAAQGRCHPLTVLDDHSRYALGLEACANEQTMTVQQRLTSIFRRYGLPRRFLVDNGAPWGSYAEHPYTPLTVWLMRLGLQVSHSRPYHPQTLGKDERFHRTLNAELLKYCQGLELADCQRRFQDWRLLYNLERPHEALDLAVPASRYRESPRSFPETLPSLEYGPGDQVRKVEVNGFIHYRNRKFRIGKAFRGEYVALRPTLTDGVFEVFFANQRVAQVNVLLTFDDDLSLKTL
jgi:transposase InsO family protein